MQHLVSGDGRTARASATLHHRHAWLGKVAEPPRLEDIEAVWIAADLGEKPAMPIPNSQGSLDDLHLRPALIQLAKTHDRIAQRWDVVDVVQHRS